jgi:hypothetical protein
VWVVVTESPPDSVTIIGAGVVAIPNGLVPTGIGRPGVLVATAIGVTALPSEWVTSAVTELTPVPIPKGAKTAGSVGVNAALSEYTPFGNVVMV